MTRLDRQRVAAAAAAFVSLGVFIYVFVHNAWFGDDPYITLRSVDNFVNGYGPVWNTDERVQVYTHPLWFLIVSAIYYFRHEGYWSILALSAVCSISTLLIAFRCVAVAWWQRFLLTLLLVSSCAWVDYSSSGLENPLSYLLLACFFGPLLRDDLAVPTAKRLFFYWIIACLAFLNRADTSLFYAPALVWLTVKSGRTIGMKRLVPLIVAASMPAWGWLVFATIYYGFPFPNTAYSKLGARGVHLPFIHHNGPLYFANNFRWDPVTLVTIGGAVCLTAWLVASRTDKWRAAAAATCGVLLYAFYTLRIGGDYMAGRFFSLPMLAASLVAVAFARQAAIGFFFSGFAISCLALAPRDPILRHGEPIGFPDDHTGVWDEASHYASSNPLLVLRDGRSPGVTSSPVGREFRAGHPKAMVWGAIGYFGFCIGPHVHGIDPIGLPDPLLARLPARNAAQDWGRGHLFHDIPDGYIASQELSENLVRDPKIHAYYDKLLIVTRGPIFTRDRFREIWRLNTGAYDDLVLGSLRKDDTP